MTSQPENDERSPAPSDQQSPEVPADGLAAPKTDPERTSRRRLIQGAAVGAAAASAVYVKPSFQSFGLPTALAASGGPTGGLPNSSACIQDSDCASNYCKDESSVGMGYVCCDPGGFCF